MHSVLHIARRQHSRADCTRSNRHRDVPQLSEKVGVLSRELLSSRVGGGEGATSGTRGGAGVKETFDDLCVERTSDSIEGTKKQRRRTLWVTFIPDLPHSQRSLW
jgi:hypothetical protein